MKMIILTWLLIFQPMAEPLLLLLWMLEAAAQSLEGDYRGNLLQRTPAEALHR